MPVVAYDRARLGFSQPGPQPREARSIAYELHAALNLSNVQGPFVLVGHSLGGLFVRVFADMFCEEIVGMVLVARYIPINGNASQMAPGYCHREPLLPSARSSVPKSSALII
jgi:pimeloyl-ACP methyl ester carboxylesterase